MGNTLVSDDGVGIYVARAVRERLEDTKTDVCVEETPLAGPALVTLLSGYDQAVIIDAVMMAGSHPGRIHHMALDDLAPTRHTASPHSLNVFTAVESGRRCGLPMPRRVRLVAVEIQDAETVAETCTPEVAAAVDEAADQVLLLLSHLESDSDIRSDF